MKSIVLLLLFAASLASNAKTLKCSANGTDVYYINGVLTNEKKNTEDKNKILELFYGRNSQLDSGPILRKDGKSAVQFIGIHNPSFGLVNDAAELFAQAYYIKNGNNHNAKAVYGLIRNLPEVAGNLASAFDQTRISSVIGMFGYTNTINFTTLNLLADESLAMALEKSAASADTLITANNAVVASVAEKIRGSQKLNRKSLLVAHSQGNSVLVAGIKMLSLNNVPKEIDYMKRYMGVYHVASPVTPLDSTYKSRNMRSNQDDVIKYFELLAQNSGLFDLIKPALVTHDVVSRVPASKDPTGHYFSDTYISPNVFLRPHGNATATPILARENFVNTLSDLATDLEDNCTYSYLQVPTTTDNITYNFSLSSGSPDLIYKWDFGDGSPIETTTSQSVTHTFPLDVTKNFQVTLTTIDSYGNSTTNSTSAYVSVTSSIKVIEGSTSYKFLRLMRDDATDYFGRPMGPTYAGLLHKRTGNLRAEGPIGTFFTMADSSEEVTSFDCGSWSRVNTSNSSSRCERISGAPYSTTFYLNKVSQCGGEGCIPLPLLNSGSNERSYNLYIPFNIDDLLNASEFHYVGEMPAAFDF